MVGANRVVRGVAITNPFGDPHRGRSAEQALRKHIVERALELLATEVTGPTVWEGCP